MELLRAVELLPDRGLAAMVLGKRQAAPHSRRIPAGRSASSSAQASACCVLLCLLPASAAGLTGLVAGPELPLHPPVRPGCPLVGSIPWSVFPGAYAEAVHPVSLEDEVSALCGMSEHQPASKAPVILLFCCLKQGLWPAGPTCLWAVRERWALVPGCSRVCLLHVKSAVLEAERH